MHNFRLCIDGRMLEGAGTGVSTYARALHATLPLVAAERFVLSDTLPGSTPIAPLRGRRLLAALLPGVRPARQIRQDGAAQGEGLFFAEDVFRRAQVHFNLYGRLLAVRVPGPPGIMHWTYPVPLRMIDWANIYTVHDVIPLNQPELTAINGPRHRRLLDRIRQAAAGLATVSAAARDDICTALRLDPSFVVDCGQPVDVAAPAAAPPAGLPPGNYLCVCGTVEPRKNIARLVNAYAASGVTLPLVIAGPDGWRADEIAGLLATTPGVVRLPWLARADMLACIGQARALLMPSLAEGFGLPVAEAMAMGTPVVTASRGALAETAGGAALLVDPEDVSALALAITRIAGDDALCAALAASGQQRAQHFTAAPFAARLAALYGGIIAGAA